MNFAKWNNQFCTGCRNRIRQPGFFGDVLVCGLLKIPDGPCYKASGESEKIPCNLENAKP